MRMDAPVRAARRRVILAVVAAVTVTLGLLIHQAAQGTIGDVAGDALYAVLIYVLAAFVVPHARPWRLALTAFAICAGIELFQLTGLPRAWAAEFPPIGLVLGSGFDARDIVVYAVAAVAASVIDAQAARMLSARSPGNAAGRPPEGERPA